MQERAWKGTTGGGKLGQRLLFAFFRYADVRIGYVCMAFVVPFYMLFARSRCLAIYHYFRQRHGYPRWKSWCKTYRNHYLFGQALLDKFSIFAGKAHTYKVTVEGQDLFDAGVNDADHAMILASSHVGNFELAGYLLSQDRKRVNGLFYGGEAEVMQRYRGQVLGHNHVNLISVTDDMSHIFVLNEVLHNHEIVTMTCDRIFLGHKNRSVSFLGTEALFPMSAFMLADRFKTRMLTLFVMREKSKHYRIHVKALQVPEGITGREERAKALAEDFVRHLEDILKRYPEQWYNYYEFWAKPEADVRPQ